MESNQLQSTPQDMSKDLLQITENTQPSIFRLGKKRKYNDEYVKYGFSYIRDSDCLKPKCIVCEEVLSNSCMKTSLLLRRLKTKHANYKNKEFYFFKCLAVKNEKE